MKLAIKLISGTVLLSMWLLFHTGCETPETYSEIPFIEFQSCQVYDTTISDMGTQKNVAIRFKFVDGDGDIGYQSSQSDTLTNNLFFSRYEQQNGKMINVDSSLVDPIVYTIPYDDVMDREGQNKAIKGTIRIDLSELVINYDTIQYKFYIHDRAGHSSNIAETTLITGLKNSK